MTDRTAATPVASYRVQLTPDLRFDDVAALLDHLVAIGVSHVYLSPVAETVPGSSHGYDVVDHTRVRAELGGEAGLAALFDAAAARGLAVLLDHVPNHTSITHPDRNRRWWEMLRDGPGSESAQWFDVDWSVAGGRVLLPLLDADLDEVLAAGRLAVDGDALVLDGALRLPLAATAGDRPDPSDASDRGDASATTTADGGLRALLERQHYRLVRWDSADRNVRRFFTIDTLVGMRVEQDHVAAEVDTLPAQWSRRTGFGGVRVDHVDGLADPAGYLRGLRARVGGDAWLLVEKILAPDETMPTWPVDGTTGYDAMRTIDHLLVDPTAEATFTALWRDVTGDARTYEEVEDAARREVLAAELLPDVERTVALAVRALGAADVGPVRDAVVELTARLPRYRTYLPDDPDGLAVLGVVASDAAAERPAVSTAISAVLAALTAPDEDARAFATRWQQLTSAAMAKGAEDRAFYRYLRLASLCEVGGDPGRFGSTVDDFHRRVADAQRRQPRAMVAGSTHDTKRSEDVRARSAALTSNSAAWDEAARSWCAELAERLHGIPPATALYALQTVVTCPGLDTSRLTEHLVKAAREAHVHTSWTAPAAEHEAQLAELADVLVGSGSDLAQRISEWSRRLDRDGAGRAVAATLLRATVPGVPDVFQGTEAFSYVLVDPDNRTAPDWASLRAVVDASTGLDAPTAWRARQEALKAVVLRRALAVRRRRPASFAPGSYARLDVGGPAADRIVAFARGDDVVIVAAIRPVERGALSGATLALSEGSWRDALDDASPVHAGTVALDELLDDVPVALLERDA